MSEFSNGREGTVLSCISDVEEMLNDWILDWLCCESTLPVEVLVMEVVEVLLVEPTSVVEMAAEDSLTEFFVLYPQAEKVLQFPTSLRKSLYAW